MPRTPIRWKSHIPWIGAVGILVVAVVLVRYGGARRGDRARHRGAAQRSKQSPGRQPARVGGDGYSLPVPEGFHVPTGALAERERTAHLVTVYADEVSAGARGFRAFVGARAQRLSVAAPRAVGRGGQEDSAALCRELFESDGVGRSFTRLTLPAGAACQERSTWPKFPGVEVLTTAIESPDHRFLLKLTCVRHGTDARARDACHTVLQGLRWE